MDSPTLDPAIRDPTSALEPNGHECCVSEASGVPADLQAEAEWISFASFSIAQTAVWIE